ncbi:hypothetical protein [Streptomyces hirsutus]
MTETREEAHMPERDRPDHLVALVQRPPIGHGVLGVSGETAHTFA